MKSNNKKSIKYLDDFQYAIKQGLEEGWEVSIYTMSDFDWFEKKYPKLERVLNAADVDSKIAGAAENLITAMKDFIEVVNDESIEKEYEKFAIPFMKEMVQVHTNGIENFWSIVKRGVYGIFHNVSMKHLQNYVDEFCFRLNYRDYDIAFKKIVELAVA